MKSVVCFLFVLLNVIYLTPIADNGRMWGGINLITLYGFIGYLCLLVDKIKALNKNERLFFEYVKWMSWANCPYILVCIIRGKGYGLLHTDIFAYIIGIGFIAFLIHCALNNKE